MPVPTYLIFIKLFISQCANTYVTLYRDHDFIFNERDVRHFIHLNISNKHEQPSIYLISWFFISSAKF